MAWVNQLINDPALVNSTSWQTVQEEHKKWATNQPSLGPVSSAIVMLVVAVATAGPARRPQARPAPPPLRAPAWPAPWA